MPRLNVVTPALATGATKDLYDAITRALGGVPNIYQGVGNSAPALGAVLGIGEALKRGQLTAAEAEAIKLVVSQTYDCTYCLAAHTLLGKKAGLSDEDAVNIRRGFSGQPKIAALVSFVTAVIQPAARLSDGALHAIKAAGYNDAQITEALLVIAQTVFTTLFNRVHQTPLDFPAAPSLQAAVSAVSA
jgi:AhpD family alkylhydroperoxidase